jgi:hypothetical protein
LRSESNRLRSMHKRIERERKTLTQMMELYCRGNHSSNELCAECVALLEYAHKKLEKCPFQEGKPTCGKCPVHCYSPDRREKIRAVMRYSGPRMMFTHPIATIWHLIDSRRDEPVNQKAKMRDKKQ